MSLRAEQVHYPQLVVRLDDKTKACLSQIISRTKFDMRILESSRLRRSFCTFANTKLEIKSISTL